MKNLIILLLIVTGQLAISQELDSEGYLKLDNIVSAITDKDDLQRADDIGYFKVLPQVKENQTPEESVSVEFFVGNYDGSNQSKNKLKFIQEIISDDKKINPNTQAEVWGIAASGLDVNKTKEFTHIINTFGLQGADKKFENVEAFTEEIKKNLSLQKEEHSTSTMLNTLIEKIIDENGAFEVPPSILEGYLKDMVEKAGDWKHESAGHHTPVVAIYQK
jgi:hypothetical protein